MANEFFNATSYIAADPASYKPIMNNHYILTITGFEGKKNYARSTATKIVNFTQAEAELSLKIANQTFAEPNLQQGFQEIKKGNMSISFPGAINAMSSTATFQVYVSKSAYDILYSWKMESGNQVTGEVGDPQEYWREVKIDLVSGNRGVIYGTWTLKNAWISSLQGVTFSNDSSEVRSVSVTMHYYMPSYTSTTSEWEEQAKTYTVSQ